VFFNFKNPKPHGAEAYPILLDHPAGYTLTKSFLMGKTQYDQFRLHVFEVDEPGAEATDYFAGSSS